MLFVGTSGGAINPCAHVSVDRCPTFGKFQEEAGVERDM